MTTQNNRTRTRTRSRAVASESVSVTEVNSGVSTPVVDETVTSPVDLDCQNPARVRVEGSITQNMGDFNSVRVGVCIEMPCLPNEAAINETYERVSALVDEKLNNELDLATGQQ